MDMPDLERLNVMLQRLPKPVFETAQVCWEDFRRGSIWSNDPVGVSRIAASYVNTLARGGKKTPHKLEKELISLAASFRDLRGKLEWMSQECLDLLRCASMQSQWKKIKGGKNGKIAAQPDYSEWFRIFNYDDGSSKKGKRILELDGIAEFLDSIAKDENGKKQAPNGPRNGSNGSIKNTELLLFNIGRMVIFRGRPLAHILLIARTIQEWSTGALPREGWGERPLKRIKPKLKEQHWDVPEEVRCPGIWNRPGISQEVKLQLLENVKAWWAEKRQAARAAALTPP